MDSQRGDPLPEKFALIQKKMEQDPKKFMK